MWSAWELLTVQTQDTGEHPITGSWTSLYLKGKKKRKLLEAARVSAIYMLQDWDDTSSSGRFPSLTLNQSCNISPILHLQSPLTHPALFFLLAVSFITGCWLSLTYLLPFEAKTSLIITPACVSQPLQIKQWNGHLTVCRMSITADFKEQMDPTGKTSIPQRNKISCSTHVLPLEGNKIKLCVRPNFSEHLDKGANLSHILGWTIYRD